MGSLVNPVDAKIGAVSMQDQAGEASSIAAGVIRQVDPVGGADLMKMSTRLLHDIRNAEPSPDLYELGA